MRAFSQDEHALLPSGWPRASARSFWSAWCFSDWGSFSFR